MGISVSGISENELWQYRDLANKTKKAYDKLKEDIQKILDECNSKSMKSVEQIEEGFKGAYKSETGTVKKAVCDSMSNLKSNVKVVIDNLTDFLTVIEERRNFYATLSSNISHASSSVDSNYNTMMNGGWNSLGIGWDVFDAHRANSEMEKKNNVTYNIEGSLVTINWA